MIARFRENVNATCPVCVARRGISPLFVEKGLDRPPRIRYNTANVSRRLYLPYEGLKHILEQPGVK